MSSPYEYSPVQPEKNQINIEEIQDEALLAREALLDRLCFAFQQAKKADFDFKLHKLVSTTFYIDVDTSVGKIYVAYQGHTIRLTSFEDEATFLSRAEKLLAQLPQPPAGFPVPEGLAQRVQKAIDFAEEYKGQLDFSYISPAQQALLRLLQHIPPLQTRSYQQITTALAATGIHLSVSEVEKLVNQNPFVGIIPCHRVIHANQYSGQYASGGQQMKKRLLLSEGIFVDEKNLVRPPMVASEQANNPVPMLPHTRSKTARKDVAIHYLDWIIQRYDHIRIKGAAQGKNRIKLDEIYTPMRIRPCQPASLTPQEYTFSQETEGIERLHFMGTMPLPSNFSLIQQWLQRQGPIILTGDIGSGKSMLLRYLTLQLAYLLRERLKRNTCDIECEPCWLPVPVQVKDYMNHGRPSGKPLNDFLVAYFAHHLCPTEGLADLLATQFLKGGCVVMLNGLHEVTNQLQRKQLTREMSEFIAYDSPPGNHFIITGQSEEEDVYFNRSLPKPFVFYTVESMNTREIRCFFERWFVAVGISSTYPGIPEKSVLGTVINKMCKLARLWQSKQHMRLTPLHLQTLITTYTIVTQQNIQGDNADELILLLSQRVYLQQRARSLPALSQKANTSQSRTETLPFHSEFASLTAMHSPYYPVPQMSVAPSDAALWREADSSSTYLIKEARKLLPIIQQKASAFIWPGKNILSEISFTC